MCLVCNEDVLLREIAKEPSGFLMSCFHMLVAECITFDAYTGIAIHGFLIGEKI